MSDQNETDQDRTGNGTQSAWSVFAPISHPVLKSVDPVKVSAFLRARERYENEVAEKKKEMPSLSKASYKISVDQGLLRNMHFLGELESVAPGKELARLTATDIEKWVKTLVVREDSSFDPAIVERALKGLKVQMKIANPKARMLEYCNDLFNCLDSVGYSSFKDDNPKMTVKLIQKHLHPKHFKATMQTMLEYQESLESDLGEYVRVLCEATVKYEKYMRLGRTENEQSIPTKGSRSDSKPENKAPLCLNPICAKEGKRHYVTGKTPKCDRTGPEEAKKLMKAYREKRKGKEGDARKVSQRESDSAQNSTLMNAMFGKKVERVLCADGGSDINLMPLDLFAELQKKEAVMDVEEYKVPRKYNLALTSDKEGEEIYFECDKEAVLNVKLYIRHGCYLELRNIKWYIATGHVPDPLLGRPVLEALGINTKELLEAATGKIGNSVDIAEIMGHQDYPEGSVARIIQDGVFHSDRGMPNENFKGEDESWLELGKDKPGEIDRAIDKAVQDTVDNGISEGGQKRLRELLHEYRDILRLRLGNDRHADVEPMKIELKDNVRPVRAKPRRYTTEGRIFMERYVERAIEYGFGKINTTAKWVAAPVLVKKPAPAFFRLTFDYRAINAATLSVSWPMPHLDSELADLAGSKHFATIDFVSGYWQLPLEESSQELLCFMTSNEVVQPTRCTQGAKNAAANFQSKIEPLFSTIRDQLKAWLDDFMMHNKTENGLLEGLRTFFKICRQRHLKIGIAKSHLYLKQVHWCGRLIDGGGVQFDPRNISGLQKIHLPVTAGELCEYVHCLKWMSTSIPDFQNRIEPMRKVLEEAYKKSGSRTKRSVQKITLESLGWGKEHKALFHEFQEQLHNIVKLAHRDPTMALCVYTDASDEFWAGVVTQCEKEDLDKPIEDQRHSPLAFLGGAFTGSEEWWTTFEKEAYAIYQVFNKMDYILLAENDTHIFTDHRNRLFVFNPLALDSALGRNVVLKVQRWGLYLSRFSYGIEHVEGERNVMPDIMTRWWRGYRGKSLVVKRVTHLLLEQDIVESPLCKEFEWPSIEMIHRSQSAYKKDAGFNYKVDDDELVRIKGKLWIPESDAEMQLKILVVGHCGPAGHRAKESTCSIIKENYMWKTMEMDCKEFVRSCLHCLTGKTGHRIPRPLSTTVHGTRPN